MISFIFNKQFYPLVAQNTKILITISKFMKVRDLEEFSNNLKTSFESLIVKELYVKSKI